jgi:hypothetical protein
MQGQLTAAQTHLNHHAVISALALCQRQVQAVVCADATERVCAVGILVRVVNCYVLAGVGAYEVTTERVRAVGIW